MEFLVALVYAFVALTIAIHLSSILQTLCEKSQPVQSSLSEATDSSIATVSPHKWPILKLRKMQYTCAHLVAVLLYLTAFTLLVQVNAEVGSEKFARLKWHQTVNDSYKRKLLFISGITQLSGIFLMFSLFQYTKGVTDRFRSMQVILHYHDSLNQIFVFFPIISCSLALVCYLFSFSCLISFGLFDNPSEILKTAFMWTKLNPFWHLFLFYSLFMGMTLQIYFFLVLKKYFDSSQFHGKNKQIQQFESTGTLIKLAIAFILLFIFGMIYVFGIFFRFHGILAELSICVGNLTMSITLFFTEWYLLKVKQLCECMKPLTNSK